MAAMKHARALHVLPMLLGVVVVRAEGPLVATFFDVGQGDCCWLHLPNGDDVVVDGGKPQAGPTTVCLGKDEPSGLEMGRP